ncbi:MAG: CusA/CzcA family heavy metal efflux RND transporter [Bacteroidetes bacterium]|nr:CusA/CzcA family heavy metal efflux RND transporter [Bacteroidota bacterium]
MFEKLVKYSIHHKLVVGIVLALALAGGIVGFQKLPIDAVPDITNNQVVVITQTPTLAAQEVEQFITAPLEQYFLNIQNVEDIRSTSRQGLSVITLIFSDDISILLARQLTSEQLKMAEDAIPGNFGTPQLAPITTGLGEIYQYTLETEGAAKEKYDLTELRTMQDWIVKRQLSGIEGLTEISSFGGFVKQYEISVDPSRLGQTGITLREVYDAVSANNRNTGGSYIEKNDQTYFIRGEGATSSLEDLGNIVIKMSGGVPVLVKDIAQLRFGSAKRFGALTRNGEGEAVGGIVLMLKGADSEKTINLVKERIEKINKNLPEGVVIKPFIDRTKLIDKSLKTVRNNLMEGGLIVIFVLVLLMGSIRAGLIVASVIPITMIITFGLMQIFGITANLMSLGAIDFGLLVDCSVIIVEAILHQLHHDERFKEEKIRNNVFDSVVFQTTKKVLSAALFGGLIILIVYLPILSLGGIEGKMFKPMAMTVSLALSVAILLSITYVPAMSSLLLKNEGKKEFKLSQKIIDVLFGTFKPAFDYSIKHYKSVLLASVVLFGISIALFMNMGGEFIPTLDEGDMAIDFQTPQGSSLNTTIAATTKAQQVLKKNFPEIQQIVGRIGSSEVPTDPMPPEMSDLMINLKDHSEWTSAETRTELAEKMSKVLEEEMPGTTAEFTQPIQMRFNEMIAGSKSEFAIKIFGQDLELLNKKAHEVEKVLNKMEGTETVKIERISGRPQINVKYDKAKLSQYGFNIDDLNFNLKTAFAGEAAGIFFEKEKRFDVVVRFAKSAADDLEHIRNLPVTTPEGALVKFSDLAEIDYKNAPSQISREKSNRRIIIGVSISGRDLEGYANEAAQKIEQKVKLEPGYYFEYGGSFENLLNAKNRLMLAVPAAMVLIFFLLYFSLSSFTQAGLVFSAIPFSAIGGVFALLLRGMPFSISAGVGFIALFGVAVLNGLVLISYFNQSEEQDILKRINEGVKSMFRPVVVTGLVASLGFLPMALSNSAGAEVQKPLATVVIGGLFTSTLLTLVVLPIIYMIFMRYSHNKKGL